jgi:ribonuclease J
MNPKNQSEEPKPQLKKMTMSSKTRGAAFRAVKRNQDDATKTLTQYSNASQKSFKKTTVLNTQDKLKVTFLGGLEDVGEKNMAIIEYKNNAIILDCGFNLGIELPGINYEICDTAYLETIKHKIRAYVLTHGHMDHVGGLKHIVPKFPAPIYGSRYTIGIIEKTFNDEPADSTFVPELNIINMDSHEKVKIGEFFVELIRVTHAIPDSTAVCIETPIGRIIATGDFRLDPEPLDSKSTDIERIKEIGRQGVLLMLSESSYADIEGRTPTEHTLQVSFYDAIERAEGRVFVAVFSSNINRIQMIINAAVNSGRKVALDGRSMLSYSEIAVTNGVLKIPKGTIISMREVNNIPDNKILIMCTGGQGEPNAALQRMSEGEHKYIKLKAEDTVLVSSSPIPGNEVSYDQVGNRLSSIGVKLFRHPTHELDGCGPLHVSGHAKRDELREMIQFVRPKFFVPVHGGSLRRRYHADMAIEEGIPRNRVLLPDNGDSLYFTSDSAESGGKVPHGSILIDQNNTVVSGLVVKDRLMLSEEGIISVVLTIDKKSGQLVLSPDVISRGFIEMRESEDIIKALREGMRRAVQQRYGRIELDRFKAELRDYITHFLYEQTGRSPIVIPVINIVGGHGKNDRKPGVNRKPAISAEAKAIEDQKRFQAMRARLLGQDQLN